MTKLRDMRTRGLTMKRVLVLLALATVGMAASATAAQAAGHYQRAGTARLCRVRPVRKRRRRRDPLRNDRRAQPDHLDRQRQPRLGPVPVPAHGSMVGAITGDTYRVTGVTRGTSTENLQNGQYTLTYVNTFQLVGPGPGNNLLVHEIAHITRNGDDVIVQHDNLSIDCK